MPASATLTLNLGDTWRVPLTMPPTGLYNNLYESFASSAHVTAFRSVPYGVGCLLTGVVVHVALQNLLDLSLIDVRVVSAACTGSGAA